MIDLSSAAVAPVGVAGRRGVDGRSLRRDDANVQRHPECQESCKNGLHLPLRLVAALGGSIPCPRKAQRGNGYSSCRND